MSLVQKRIELMHEKEFDEAMQSLKVQHKLVKESMAKDRNFKQVVVVMKDMKNKLNSLHSKDPEKIQLKNAMIIKLCEQAAYCYLRDENPKEALKMLSELEVMQDIFKEKNLKAIMYLGRTHLMLNLYSKAYDYFTKAYGIADSNIKKDIKPILEKIELKMVEEDEELTTKFMQTEIGQTSTLLTLEDLSWIPIGVQSVDADGDITMELLEAQQQVASINKPKKPVITGTVEICTIKPCAGILAEYTQKSGNLLPIYEVEKIVQESLNMRVFHMTCQCLDHIESGSATTKQKAKEIAAQKMLKYLEGAGKLRLTTNLGL